MGKSTGRDFMPKCLLCDWLIRQPASAISGTALPSPAVRDPSQGGILIGCSLGQSRPYWWPPSAHIRRVHQNQQVCEAQSNIRPTQPVLGGALPHVGARFRNGSNWNGFSSANAAMNSSTLSLVRHSRRNDCHQSQPREHRWAAPNIENRKVAALSRPYAEAWNSLTLRERSPVQD